MWNDLVSLMAETVEVYRVILELSRTKKKVLVAASVGELSELTKQEEHLVLQIGKLEAARKKLIGDLASAYALSVKQLTLTKIKELADADTTKKLDELGTELSAITGELDRLNKMNSQLIQQALNYVNYTLNLLTQSTVGPNYAAKGADEAAPRSKALIDAKV